MLTSSLLRATARIVLLAYGLQISVVGAQVVADPGARSGQRPLIDRTANGVPLVHIAPPSAGGVSHNQYQDFNVGKEGLILNNARQITATELGGQIPGNLQFGTESARIILNEVTGPNNSQLKGFIEVAGQRADIVVANPNGITCDGCGFLNTSRATLTTGTPQMSATGELSGFDIGRGGIHIGQGGLNASNLEQLDFLARSLVIEGEVWTKQLNAVLGANRVLYGTLKVQTQSGSAQAPRFVVDIAALGGMYANQIYLVATEKGLGVNSAGRIAALESNLSLSADGDLSVADVQARKAVELSSAGSVTTKGTVTGDSIAIKAGTAAENSGTLDATSTLSLEAHTILNSGLIAQRAENRDLAIAASQLIRNDGTVYSASNLQIAAPELSGSRGQLLAEGDIGVTASRVETTEQKWLAGKSIVVLSAGDLHARDASIDAQGPIKLGATGAALLSNSVVRSSGEIGLSAGSIDLSSAKLGSATQLAVNSQGALLADGASLSAGDAVTVDATSIHATGANILSDGVGTIRSSSALIAHDAVFAAAKGLEVNAGSVSGGAYVAQEGSVALRGSGRVELSGGGVSAGKSAELSADELITAGGIVQGGDVVVESRHSAIDNRAGEIAASASLKLRGVGIDNRAGVIRAEGAAQLDASGLTLDNSGGVLSAQDEFRISASALNNHGGSISAQRDLNLALLLDNREGAIRSAGSISVDSGSAALDNRSGILLAAGDIAVSTAKADNTGGLIRSQNGSVQIDAGAVLSDSVSGSGGTIAAAGNLGLRTGQLSAQGGLLAAGSGLSLSVQGDARLDGAQLLSAAADLEAKISGTLSASGGQFAAANNARIEAMSINGGRYSAGSTLKLASAGVLDVSGGALTAGSAIEASAATGIVTRDARVGAQQVSLDAGTGSLDNSGGTIIAESTQGDALRIKSVGVDNRAGQLVSNSGLVLDAGKGAVDNGGGRIAAEGLLDLRARSYLGARGTLATGGDLAFTSGAIDNTDATLSAGGSLLIDTQGQSLSNVRGQLLAGRNLVIAAAQFDNTAGRLASAGQLTVSADVLSSRGARVEAGQGASLAVRGAADLAGAVVNAHGDLTISSATLGTAGAGLVSDGAVAVTTGSLDNRAGTFSAGKGFKLDAGDVDNSSGRMLAGEALTINSRAFGNDHGVLSSAGSLLLDSGSQTLSNQDGVIVSKAGITLRAGGLSGAQGQIEAGTGIDLNMGAGKLLLDRGALRAVDGDIAVRGGDISARDTRIETVRDLRVSASGALDASGAQWGAGRALSLDAASKLSAEDAVLLGRDSLAMSGTDITAHRARLASDGAAALEARSGGLGLSHANVLAGAALNLQSSAAFDAQAAQIESGGNLSLGAGSGDVRDAHIRAGGSLSVSSGGLTADAATLSSGGALKLDTADKDLSLLGAKVLSQADIQVHAGTVEAGSATLSGAQLSLDSGALSADRATLTAASGTLHLQSGAMTLQAADLAARNDVDLLASNLEAGAAHIASNASVRVRADAVRASAATVDALGSIAIHSAGEAGFYGGALKAGAAIDLQAGGDTGAAQLIAGGPLSVVAGGAGHFAGARIGSVSSLDLVSQGLDSSAAWIAATDIRIDAGSGALANRGGAVLASGALTVRAGALDNADGQFRASGDIKVAADSLNNSGGTIASAGRLDIDANRDGVDNTKGTLIAVGDLNLSSAGSLVNEGGAIASAHNASLQAASSFHNQGGQLQADGALQLVAQGIDNQSGTLSAGAALTASAGSGAFNNRHGSYVAGAGATLDAGQLINQDGVVSAAGALAVNAGTEALDNRAGLLRSSTADLLLHSGAVDNTSSGLIAAAGRLDVQSSGAIDNRGARIEAGSGVSILAAGALDNRAGSISSAAQMSLVATGLANANGLVVAGDSLGVDAGSGGIDNHSGDIRSQGALTLKAGGALDNTLGRLRSNAGLILDMAAADNAGGLISTGGDATLATQGFANAGGQVLAAGSLKLDARGASLDGVGGVLAANDNMTLSGSAVNIGGAQLGVGGSLNITGGAIHAAGSELQSRGNLVLNAGSGTLDLSGSRLRTNGAATLAGDLNAGALDLAANAGVTLSGANIAANDAKIASGADVSVSSVGALSARNAVFSAARDLSVQGGNSDLFSTQLSAGRDLRLSVASYLDLSSGVTSLSAGNDLSLHSQGLSVAGRSFDAHSLVLDAGSGVLLAAGSTLGASGDASLSGRGIDIHGARIGANGTLTVDAGSGNLDNRAGQLVSAGSLAATAGALQNDDGVMGSESGGSTLSVAGSFSNARGRVVSAGGTTVHANGLDNTNGLISGTAIDVSAGSGALVNTTGVLSGLDRAVVTGGAITNDSGIIEAGASGLTLTADSLSNRNSGADRGIITTGDARLTLSGALDNASGYIGANGAQTLVAGSVGNAAGTLRAGSQLTVNTGVIDNRGGAIESAGDATLTASSLDNRSGGLVFAAHALTATIGQIDNRDTRTGAFDRGLLAGAELTISSAAMDNRSGAVVAGTALSVGATGTLDNSGGQLAGDTVSLTAATFTNTAGRVDGRRSLATQLGRFSADGVMASNGSLDIHLASDYTNTGTLAANGNLSITTTGNYSNAGKLSATDTFSLTAQNLNNQASGEIVGARTIFDVSGTLNNDGVINASSGSTRITAGTLNNAGSIFGDSIVLSGGAVNNAANAVIASRSTLDATLSSLSNRDNALIYGASDVSISANVTNSSATIQAGNKLALTGTVLNTTPYRKTISESGTSGSVVEYVQASDGNPQAARGTLVADASWANAVVQASRSGFKTTGQAIQGGPALYTPRAAGDASAIYVITGGEKNYRILHPDTFGTSLPYAELDSSICNYGLAVPSCTTQRNYTITSPIWAVMGVTPPSTPEPEQCKNMLTTGPSAGSCAMVNPDWLDWKANTQPAWAQLDAAIKAHNAVVASQNEVVEFEDYLRYSYTRSTTTSGEVGDRPAQLLAGGDLVVNGSLSNDRSTVSAGGSVLASVKTNIGSSLIQTSIQEGSLTDSRVESSGGWMGGHSRNDSVSPYHQSTGAVSVAYSDYALIEHTTSTPASVPAGPSPSAAPGGASVPVIGASVGSGRSGGSSASVSADGGNASSGGSSGTPAAVSGMPIALAPVAGVDARSPGATALAGADAAGIAARAQVDLATSGVSGAPSAVTASGPDLGSLSALPSAPLPGSVIAAGARATQTAQLDSLRVTFAKAAAERATRVDATRVSALADAAEHSGIGVSLQPATPDGAQSAIERAASLDGSAILAGRGRLSAPDNKLFTIHAEPGLNYLIETDPRFTNYKQFISSQYFIDRLQVDPEKSLKRYGDGFAEQRLIEQQVRALTGRQMLAGYADTEAQYLALMNAGIEFAQAYQFSPGVALSAEQMAKLTSDIVWLETSIVDTAQGPQTVLVPRVYLRAPRDGDLQPSGGLIAGSDVVIRNGAEQGLENSGSIVGGSVSVDVAQLSNRQGQIAATDSLAIRSKGDIENLGGSLSAGKSLDLLAGGKLVVRSEPITLPDGNSFAGRVARVRAGGDLTAYAGQSLSLTGAQLDAQGRIVLASAGDLSLDALTTHTRTATATARGGQIGEAHTEQLGTRIVGGKDVALIAGLAADGSRSNAGDIHAIGADIQAGANLALEARAIDIQAAVAKDESWVDAQRKRGYTKVASSDERSVGGTLAAGSDLTLSAHDSAVGAVDGKIALTGASLRSDRGTIGLAADSDVSLDALMLERRSQSDSRGSSKGVFSTTTTTARSSQVLDSVQGTQLSGNAVRIESGRDVTLKAATVVGDQAVSIDAARDVQVGSAVERTSQLSEESKRKSGVFSSGLSINFGTNQLDQSQSQQQQTDRSSTLASLGGDLQIHAGGDYRQNGGTLITGKAGADGKLAGGGDIAVDARSITITEARQESKAEQAVRFRQGGLTVAIKSPIIDMIQGLQSLEHAASTANDSRMTALAGATAVLETARGLESLTKTPAEGQAPEATVRIAISIGNSRNSTETRSTESSAQVATLAAGKDLTLKAHGAGEASDITARGVEMRAAGDTTLAAAGDITLAAAQNRATYEQQSKSQAASIGVSFNLGQKLGLTLDVAASGSKGDADGHQSGWSASSVEAGGTLKLASGGDTTLSGTQARGERIEAQVGRNLAIESLQGAHDYKSKQVSGGFNASIGFGTSSFGVNAALSKLDAYDRGVTDQAGLFAGSGGFDVQVGQQTRLTGAVISSTAGADQNHLSTGTLTTQDLENEARLKAMTVGLSFSSSGAGMSPGISFAARNEHERSATQSAIAQGSVTIRDEAAQQALTGRSGASTVEALNRDTAHAHTRLNSVFDTATVQQVEREVGATAAITQRAAAAGFKEAGNYATDQVNKADSKDYAASQYRNAANEAEAAGDSSRAASLNATADQLTVDAAQQKATWEEGGIGRIALHTAVGALTGGAEGALGAAVNQAATPLVGTLTEGIENKTVREIVRETGSALIGGAVGGGVGAATTLSADVNNRQLHVSEREKLKAKARTIVNARAKGALTAEQRSEAEQYWYDQLNAEALAAVDDQGAQWRTQYLKKVAGSKVAGLNGAYLADAYLADAAYARKEVSSMAGEVILGKDGRPIVADGSALQAFKATDRQRQDSQLFGGGFMPLSNDLIQRFGSMAAARNAQATESAQANGLTGGAMRRDEQRLKIFRGANGLAEPNTTDVDLLTSVVPGLRVAAKLLKTGVGRLAGEQAAAAAARAGAKGGAEAANSAKPLSYDISKWGEYGLPSDGYFSRTLSREQYLDLKAGRTVSFAGKPVEGYPGGMGFISSAEEARAFSTVKDYREGLKLAYDPSKYVLEFQLRDTTGLRNVLDAPYPEFVPRGKTGSGFKEWNYPGLNNNDIVNWRVRVLK